MGCGRVAVYCRRCYRGQRYCGDECRRLARIEQCRRAQATYLSKVAGRRSRAEATAACRMRKAAREARSSADQKVIDQTLLPSDQAAYSWPCEARCSRCGQPGWARGPRRER